jgi:hypothetical protein
MNGQRIGIPEEWLVLTDQREMIWIDEYNDAFNPKIPLLYESANLYGLATFIPWTNPDETVPKLLLEWNRIREELKEGFTKRDLSKTERPMKKGIGLLFQVIYWTNYQPVDVHTVGMESLQIKPINIRERVDYIILNPNKFHSFIQLSEAFVEMEKLFRKHAVMNKANQLKE